MHYIFNILVCLCFLGTAQGSQNFSETSLAEQHAVFEQAMQKSYSATLLSGLGLASFAASGFGWTSAIRSLQAVQKPAKKVAKKIVETSPTFFQKLKGWCSAQLGNSNGTVTRFFQQHATRFAWAGAALVTGSLVVTWYNNLQACKTEKALKQSQGELREKNEAINALDQKYKNQYDQLATDTDFLKSAVMHLPGMRILAGELLGKNDEKEQNNTDLGSYLSLEKVSEMSIACCDVLLANNLSGVQKKLTEFKGLRGKFPLSNNESVYAQTLLGKFPLSDNESAYVQTLLGSQEEKGEE